jgi:hypothetical protein
MEFLAVKETISGWLEHWAEAMEEDSPKSVWKLPFDLTNKLVSLVAFATGSLTDETEIYSAARTGFGKGFVDYTTILGGIRNIGISKSSHTPSNHQQNAPRNPHRFFRGRGRGGRGRGRGRG